MKIPGYKVICALGTRPAITVFQTHHVIEFRRRNLQNIAILNGDHTMLHQRHNMQALARRQTQLLLLAIFLNIQFKHASEQPNRLVLDVVKLVTQGFPFVDVQYLPDVAIGMSPNQLITPWFINKFIRVGQSISHNGPNDTRLSHSGKQNSALRIFHWRELPTEQALTISPRESKQHNPSFMVKKWDIAESTNNHGEP